MRLTTRPAEDTRLSLLLTLAEIQAALRQMRRQPSQGSTDLDAVGAHLEAAQLRLRDQLAELGRRTPVDKAAEGANAEDDNAPAGAGSTTEDAEAGPGPAATRSPAIVHTDLVGGIARGNPAASRLLAVPRAVLLQKPLFAYIEPDRRRGARRLLHDALTSGRTVRRVVSLRPRGGPLTLCEATVTPTVAVDPRPGPATSESDDGPGDARTVRTVQRVEWILEPIAEDEPADVEAIRAALVRLCELGPGAGELGMVLQTVVALACEAIPGVDSASIILGSPVHPEQNISTSQDAQVGDGAQFIAQEGASVDAWRTAVITATGDLSADSRWPGLGPLLAPERAVRACLAVPLTGSADVIGVLTLYSRDRDSLALTAANEVLPFATAAEALVRDQRLVEEITQTSEQLRFGLTTRAVIDQAKGMIMLHRRCTSDEAFEHLRELSMQRNQKVRDIAQAMVDSVRP